MSVGPRTEKFNTISNDHGRTQKCFFSFRHTENTLFLAKYGPKNLNCQWKQKFGT